MATATTYVKLEIRRSFFSKKAVQQGTRKFGESLSSEIFQAHIDMIWW